MKERPLIIYMALLVTIALAVYFIGFLMIKAGEMQNNALKQCIDTGKSIEYCKSLLY